MDGVRKWATLKKKKVNIFKENILTIEREKKTLVIPIFVTVGRENRQYMDWVYPSSTSLNSVNFLDNNA